MTRTGFGTVRALWLAIAVTASCGTASAPAVTHAVYEYSLAPATDDLHPGQALVLTWKATLGAARSEALPGTVRMCVALAGPYASVEELKGSAVTAQACPIAVPRTVVASETAEADRSTGKPVDQRLTLPASLAPGYYELLGVRVFGPIETSRNSFTGNSSSASGIVRVIRTP